MAAIDPLELNFGEILGFYLWSRGVIADPRDVGQADLHPADGAISFIRRSGEGDMEYHMPAESSAEVLFEGMKAARRWKDS